MENNPFVDFHLQKHSNTFIPKQLSLCWWALGCPKITPCEKCLAPNAFSGAKFQV